MLEPGEPFPDEERRQISLLHDRFCPPVSLKSHYLSRRVVASSEGERHSSFSYYEFALLNYINNRTWTPLCLKSIAGFQTKIPGNRALAYIVGCPSVEVQFNPVAREFWI
jgi:hypothetical protein